MTKVLMAMSGGVDSTVSALLLREKGYDLVGLTMRLYPPTPQKWIGENGEVKLPLAELTEDEQSAMAMAKSLGIDFHLIDLSLTFEEKVIRPFIETYEKGGTPNPCVFCNKHIKFGALFSYARSYGCDFVSTGHYASVERVQGTYQLKRGKDRSKDQSYMLFQMGQKELSKVLFPLGELYKEEVRTIAEKAGLASWNRPDSEDICFIPNGNYVDFCQRHERKKYGPGKLVDRTGEFLGEGKNPIAYTIGQRRGLGLARPEPTYVLDKDMEKGAVIVGKEEDLFFQQISCSNWNWMSGKCPQDPLYGQVKIRYLAKEAPCVMESLSAYPDRDKVVIRFDKPQRAPAPGQSAVAYDGDLVLGGGTICKVLDKEE